MLSKRWLARMAFLECFYGLGDVYAGKTAQELLSFGETHLCVTSSVFIAISVVQAWCSCQIRD